MCPYNKVVLIFKNGHVENQFESDISPLITVFLQKRKIFSVTIVIEKYVVCYVLCSPAALSQ